jgi:hypothetical protein
MSPGTPIPAADPTGFGPTVPYRTDEFGFPGIL